MPGMRLAMWSGPRNISTALMRAFENRPDTAVADEPFYAAYLVATGLQHPLREAVIASQPHDWRDVVAAITGSVPEGRPIWYQKHMTHHMLDSFGFDWIDDVTSAFLIRAPEGVLASYAMKRREVTLAEIGLPRQVELFERVAERLGRVPPVIEANDVLADPRGTLTLLCQACGIPFSETMLAWPAGPRPTDGVWAPAWYDTVEKSTGFACARPEPTFDELSDDLRPIAAAARPLYERLSRYRLTPASPR